MMNDEEIAARVRASVWRLRRAKKLAVRKKVHAAVRSGKLIKPDACERCGIVKEKSEQIQAHHPDYNEPLEVCWLCPKCHGGEHKRRDYIEPDLPEGFIENRTAYFRSLE